MSPFSRLNNPPQHSVDELILTLVGEDAPSEAQNGTLCLSTLRGTVVVLLILGVDCGSCKHLARELSSLHHEYAPEVSFVGVCVQSGCRDRLTDFNQGAQAAFPLASVPSRELCPALGIPKATWLFFPTMIFLDREQRLRGLFIAGDEFFNDPINNTRAALDAIRLETASLQVCSEATV